MERFVEVPGGRLFAKSDGVGPPIVLLHAAIADHRAWDPMVPGLIAAGFAAVRYDYRRPSNILPASTRRLLHREAPPRFLAATAFMR